jgi:hypothetical protein
MPKGPKGEKRPADVVGAAVKTMKVHPSQADDLFLRLGGVSRRINDGLLKSLLWVMSGSHRDVWMSSALLQ